jgi:hypothetical protein
MRFVIGIWWILKKPPRQRRQKYFLIAVMMMMFRVVVPRSGEDDVASGKVFPLVNNQGNRTKRRSFATPRNQPLHTRKQISTPNATKGLSSP